MLRAPGKSRQAKRPREEGKKLEGLEGVGVLETKKQSRKGAGPRSIKGCGVSQTELAAPAHLACRCSEVAAAKAAPGNSAVAETEVALQTGGEGRRQAHRISSVCCSCGGSVVQEK